MSRPNLNVSLFVRNDRVYLLVNKLGDKFILSTKKPAKGFSEKKQRWTNNATLNREVITMVTALENCEDIDEAKALAETIIADLRALPKVDNRVPHRKTIAMWMGEYLKEEVTNSNLSPTRKNTYVNAFRVYEQSGEPVDAARVDLYRANTQREKAERISFMEQRWRKFERAMIERGDRPATQSIRMTCIKTFLKWMEEKRGVKIPDTMEPPRPDSRNIVVPLEVTKDLIKLPIQGNRNGYWTAVCKMMLIGGLRFGDAYRVSLGDITDDGIEIVTEKTNRPEMKYVPPQYIKEIRRGLKGRYRKGKRGARNLFAEWLRDTVRVIPGGDTPVHDWRTKPDGSKEKYGGPLWQVINPHDLRGASVNLLLHLGATPDVAMAQGGWKSERVFRKHYLDPNGHLPKVAKIFEKL